MKRLLRWVVLGTLGVVVLVVAAGMAVLYSASRSSVELFASGNFAESTGLEVETGGRFDPVLWPIPGWQLGAITISDPQSASDVPLLAAQDSLLTLAPLGLLQGTLNIGALWLENVRVQVPEPGSETRFTQLPSDQLFVSFLRLKQAEISIGQDGADAYQTASMDFASLDYAGAKRPLRLSLDGTWRSRRIEGTAKLTSPDRAARGDWVFADATLRIDGDTITYSGRVRPDLSQEIPIFAGNVTATIANPAGAVAWLTQTPANETLINLRNLTLEGRIDTLPERLFSRTRWAGDYIDTRVSLDATLRGDSGWRERGIGSLNATARGPGLFSSYLNGSFARDQGVSGDLSLSVLDLPGMFQAGIFPDAYRFGDARNGSVKGRLSATTQGLAMSDATLLLGPDRYTGDVAIDLRGDRPIVSLGTAIETLDLKDWIDPVLDGSQPLAQVLPTLNPELVFEITADTVRYEGIEAGPMVASVTTRSEETVLDLRQLDLAGGVLAGSVSVPANSSIARLDLTAAEIDSAQALQAFDLSGLSGILAGSMRAEVPLPLGAQGWTGVRADGTLSLFQARVDGLDVRARDTTPAAQTQMTQADVTFRLRDQLLTADPISLRDAAGRMSGTGTVDLASRVIAGTLTPDAEPSGKVELAGTLDAPAIADATSGTSQDETAEATVPPVEASKPTEIPPAPDEPAESAQSEATEQLDAVEVPEPADPEEPAAPETQVSEAPQVAEPDVEATGPQSSPVPRRPQR